MTKIKIILLCGGPSPEKSISLNSTRSVLDNLDKEKFLISIIYFDAQKNPYLIPSFQLYSNTVFDFEFKIKKIGQKLTKTQFTAQLKSCDVAWPIMHGEFGEDGTIQKIIAQSGANFVGTQAKGAQETISKYLAQEKLKENGFFVWGTKLIKKGEPLPKLPAGHYVTKPDRAGSSLGVEFVRSNQELAQKITKVFEYGPEAVLEKFCPGREFTILVLENKKGEPVPLIPTEIGFKKGGDSFFSFRKKYLATDHIHFFTPPRFTEPVVNRIREEAKKVFLLFELRDYARFDGWLLPDGQIWFSDLNPITGMEQNSFIFRQAAFLGLNHAGLLNHLANKVAARTVKTKSLAEKVKKKKKVAVVFGGETAERQISLLSGTNVFIKLKSSTEFEPIPVFLSPTGDFWRIPYFFALNHTVEEIDYLIQKTDTPKIERFQKMTGQVVRDLDLSAETKIEKLLAPQKTDLKKLSREVAFVFLALHGGPGEDGTFQEELTKLSIPFNGSGAEASRLGMDKWATGQVIQKLNYPGLESLPKLLIKSSDSDYGAIWKKVTAQLKTKSLVLKPRADGCSAGVAKINNVRELTVYLTHLKERKTCIPGGLLGDHPQPVELPKGFCTEVVAEQFITTDRILIKGKKLIQQKRSSWIELSVGVLGSLGKLTAFTPSQTIASGKILSLEEKFQGGTGINFTPPPEQWFSPADLRTVKKMAAKAANALGIAGYARLDLFFNLKTKKVLLIEANTLPALTPSTIIYHQALAEKPAMFPLAFLEKIIKLGLANSLTQGSR